MLSPMILGIPESTPKSQAVESFERIYLKPKKIGWFSGLGESSSHFLLPARTGVGNLQHRTMHIQY
jgi:hypothetical protein